MDGAVLVLLDTPMHGTKRMFVITNSTANFSSDGLSPTADKTG